MINPAIDDVAKRLKVIHKHFACFTRTQSIDKHFVDGKIDADVFRHIIHIDTLSRDETLNVNESIIDQVWPFGHQMINGLNVSESQEPVAQGLILIIFLQAQLFD